MPECLIGRSVLWLPRRERRKLGHAHGYEPNDAILLLQRRLACFLLRKRHQDELMRCRNHGSKNEDSSGRQASLPRVHPCRSGSTRISKRKHSLEGFDRYENGLRGTNTKIRNRRLVVEAPRAEQGDFGDFGQGCDTESPRDPCQVTAVAPAVVPAKVIPSHRVRRARENQPIGWQWRNRAQRSKMKWRTCCERRWRTFVADWRR